MAKTVVLLRGGVDSSICLAKAVQDFGKDNVFALNLFYGQKSSKERGSAKEIADHYGVKYIALDISEVLSLSTAGVLKDNDLTPGEDVYQEQTEVPFRNGLMISTAASVALSMGAEQVEFALHADESAGQIYPDLKEDFFRAMATAIETGPGGKLKLLLPYIDISKKEVMELGRELNVPFEKTWSCYVNDDEPCGYCTGCVGRAKAFASIGMEDPLA